MSQGIINVKYAENKMWVLGGWKVPKCLLQLWCYIGSGWDGVHFSTAALAVLCFGLVARMVLITHPCFGYCWAGPAEHHLSTFLPSRGWGWARSWEGHNQASWPKLTKGIIQTTWISARWDIKAKGGGLFVILHCFPSGTMLTNFCFALSQSTSCFQSYFLSPIPLGSDGGSWWLPAKVNHYKWVKERSLAITGLVASWLNTILPWSSGLGCLFPNMTWVIFHCQWELLWPVGILECCGLHILLSI